MLLSSTLLRIKVKVCKAYLEDEFEHHGSFAWVNYASVNSLERTKH